jgi:hypothetical protein
MLLFLSLEDTSYKMSIILSYIFIRSVKKFIGGESLQMTNCPCEEGRRPCKEKTRQFKHKKERLPSK